jgi:hypothetical protein
MEICFIANERRMNDFWKVVETNVKRKPQPKKVKVSILI